jgi:hypothetical protein
LKTKKATLLSTKTRTTTDVLTPIPAFAPVLNPDTDGDVSVAAKVVDGLVVRLVVVLEVAKVLVELEDVVELEDAVEAPDPKGLRMAKRGLVKAGVFGSYVRLSALNCNIYW